MTQAHFKDDFSKQIVINFYQNLDILKAVSLRIITTKFVNYIACSLLHLNIILHNPLLASLYPFSRIFLYM